MYTCAREKTLLFCIRPQLRIEYTIRMNYLNLYIRLDFRIGICYSNELLRSSNTVRIEYRLYNENDLDRLPCGIIHSLVYQHAFYVELSYNLHYKSRYKPMA